MADATLDEPHLVPDAAHDQQLMERELAVLLLVDGER